MSEAAAENATGQDPERSNERRTEMADDFWQLGPGLAEFAAQPFAADDPEALPRRLGPLPGDLDGRATEELHRLYSLLADEAEREVFGADNSVGAPHI